VNLVLFARERDAAFQRVASRGTNHVPDQQHADDGNGYRRADALAFFCAFRK
jgi:hypothetical protein